MISIEKLSDQAHFQEKLSNQAHYQEPQN